MLRRCAIVKNCASNYHLLPENNSRFSRPLLRKERPEMSRTQNFSNFPWKLFETDWTMPRDKSAWLCCMDLRADTSRLGEGRRYAIAGTLWGIPKVAIRLRILLASRASICWFFSLRERRIRPMQRLKRQIAASATERR